MLKENARIQMFLSKQRILPFGTEDKGYTPECKDSIFGAHGKKKYCWKIGEIHVWFRG